MIKKIIYTLMSLTIMHSALLFSQTAYNISCEPQLRNYLETIQKLSEGKQLITNILKEGPLQIRGSGNAGVPMQFGACWDAGRRIIYVSTSSHRTHGEIIGSLIFELHNALNTAKFDNLDYLASMGKLDRSTYVREVERIEYKNSIESAKLANLGIQKGIFAKSARLPVYRSFDEHFYYQQIGGHSAVIARNYDSMNPSTYYACHPRKYRRSSN